MNCIMILTFTTTLSIFRLYNKENGSQLQWCYPKSMNFCQLFSIDKRLVIYRTRHSYWKLMLSSQCLFQCISFEQFLLTIIMSYMLSTLFMFIQQLGLYLVKIIAFEGYQRMSQLNDYDSFVLSCNSKS